MSTRSAAPLRLAVIGAGLSSAPHFRSLADLAAQVEVAWVLGRDLQRLQAAALPPGARLSTRLADALDDASVQAVLVLTPPNTHLDIVRQAAQAGKHVLVEKPLEIDLVRATALVEACEGAGVQLGVMLQHRQRPGAQAVADLLRTRRLGPLVSVSASVRWWRPQSYYDVPGRGTLARDGGGVLITQAIHTLDSLFSFTGLPERVTALARTSAAHRMEGEDTAAALLQFAGGAVGVVLATTAAYPGFAERIELNGALGTATLASGAMKAEFIDGSSATAGAAQGTGGGADPMAFDHGAHRAVLQDFIHAVQGGRAPAVSGRSALAVQRVIEAMMVSSHSGHSVAVEPAVN